jgi:hypothetical protein
VCVRARVRVRAYMSVWTTRDKTREW